MARSSSASAKRPVLFQLCRAGERFEVGDGPTDLTSEDAVIVGRGESERNRSGRIYVDDPWMSSKHARLYRDPHSGKFHVEDLESTNGVLVNGNLVGREPLKHGDLIETGRTFWLFTEEPASIPLPEEPMEFGTWSTWSPPLADALTRLETEVESNAHILITGPEGSGKGFLARTVHLMSGRAGRLVHLDCRERRPRRLVVDLFGGEGQSARLREADLGTLFLENVDALPKDIQERLADTLKKGGFIPDGKTRRVACDVRVIASSTARPEDDATVFKKRFIEIVSEVRIDLPGLDERKPDLGLLLDDFLARARGASALSRDACRAVMLHPWRQHVKAFARVIESAAVLAAETDDDGNRRGRVELAHLPVEVIGVDALRALLPPAVLERPPSIQGVRDVESTSHLDTPASDRRPPPIPDDPEMTSEVHESELAALRTSTELKGAVDEIQGIVAAFDELGETDPAQRRFQNPLHREPRRPTVRALDPSSGDAPQQERPPSAYHDLSSIERSYASAVDPDLIVDALRRSHGNVSAAARYLGKPRALVLRWMREFGLEAADYRAE